MPQNRRESIETRHSSFPRRGWPCGASAREEKRMFFNHGQTRTTLTNVRVGRARTPAAPHIATSGRACAPRTLHWLVTVCSFFALVLTSFASDPAITVSARQRYPWNGLVDINFIITGTSGTKYDTSFTAKDMVGNTNIAMRTIRKADGSAVNVAKEQLLPGNYNWVWDAAADLPKDFKCDRVTVTATAGIAPFPYSVKFNANGGTGTMSNESFTYGTAKALTANAFTRTGYTFQGWATSASGAKVYSDKQSVSNLTETSGAVVNLYAVWNGIAYSVKFNANGGSGTMANESFTYGTAKALNANVFTRTGYTFQGWATSASGAKVYNDKQSVSNLSTTAGAVVSLYAVWDHSKVQLWEGGPYWATTNIGAGKPEECGYYFWWADIIGYKRVNNKWVASDGSSSDYYFGAGLATSEGKDLESLYRLGWIESEGEDWEDWFLTPAHDAAHVHWGGNWRVPSRLETQALISNCTWLWTTTNGVKGYVIKGKGKYASASIFLPCSSFAAETSLASSYKEYGFYWTSYPETTNASMAYSLNFSSGFMGVGDTLAGSRHYGMQIRPVERLTE